MDYTESLKEFPLLEKIPEADLRTFSALLQVRRVSAGDCIVREGEPGDEMFLLIRGSVDVLRRTVYGDTFVVATLDDRMHCVFGEMAVIDHDRRSSTVQARTDCMALSITREDFDRFCDENPRSGVELLRLIAVNLARNIRKENDNLKQVYQALIEEIEAG